MKLIVKLTFIVLLFSTAVHAEDVRAKIDRVLNDPRLESPEIALLEPFIREAFIYEHGDLSLRLYAATTLIKIAKAEHKEEATRFVLDLEQRVRDDKSINLHSSGPVLGTDLDRALAQINSRESRQKLLNRLKTCGQTSEQIYIISLLQQDYSNDVVEALFEFCEDRRWEPQAQLKAAQILSKSKRVRNDRLLSLLYTIRDRAPAYYLDPMEIEQLIDQANQAWQQELDSKKQRQH